MPRKTPLKETLKRAVSGFLIFALLFGQTLHIPLLEISKAAESDFPNLVTVVVNEGAYSGDLDNKIDRYAADVQASLPGSRVSVVTIPNDTPPEKIAALLEKLYYEGDGNGVSRLVGTVLVGDIPLPVVHRGEKSLLSVFPYVDFADKSFTYDAAKGYYEYAASSAGSDTPEIWHGIVHANSGDAAKDREKLGAFFDKTHDFYAKTGVFEKSKTRIEPAVFYFDSYHDQLSSRSSEWKAYRLMLANIEELAYRRYSKHLAKSVYDLYQGYLWNVGTEAAGTEIGDLLAAYTGSTLDFSTAPDIQTKEPIEKTLKQFFNVLSEQYVGNILRYVHNAGRYGDGNDIRADIPASLVGKGDEVMKRTLKDANTVFESAIDQLVRNGLSRNIAIGTVHTVNANSGTTSEGVPLVSSTTYRNYLFGKTGESITTASQCSIVRGSSLPVEANRGYNTFNSENDVNVLNASLPNGGCFAGGEAKTMAFWGGNSPLNLDFSVSDATKFLLKTHRYDLFVSPAFDIGGSREITPGGDLPIQTPNDCRKIRKWIADGTKCTTDTESTSVAILNYEDYLQNGFPPEACTIHTLTLNGSAVKSQGGYCEDAGVGGSGGEGATTSSAIRIDKTYAYKTIPSVIEHKSPTDEEFGAEAKNFVTPSLPADRDRYVDFISAKGNYIKIPYPNFYRIRFNENEEVTAENARTKIKELLDAKSAEINATIQSEAGSVSGAFATGTYPSANIDFFKKIEVDPVLFDAITDAVVWNNLDNATAKYAYILEHHLDIDGNSKYPIAGHKSDYEVAYFAGSGDAANLYVKLDPEAKDGPGAEIGEILKKAAELRGTLDAANLSSSGLEKNAQFKCGPPDGVPLWEWLPAVFCWLSSILPPTVTAGSCSPASFEVAKEIEAAFARVDKNGDGKPDYLQDANGNGIIDGAEYVKDGKIELSATPKKSAYRETVRLTADLLGRDGKRIWIDSLNEVGFDVARVVSYSGTVSKEAYVRGATGELWNPANIRDYVNFTPVKVRAKDGQSTFTLSALGRDADIFFDATVAPKDKNGVAAFTKVSNLAKLEIRDEGLKIGLSSGSGGISTYLPAGEFPSVNFDVKKVTKAGEGAVSFPVVVKVFDDESGESLGNSAVISGKTYSYSGGLLKKAGNYRFEFTDKDGTFGSRTITVTPGLAASIELVPSSTLFVKNEKATVLVRVLDRFGNYAKGDLLGLVASVSGGGYFEENHAAEVKKTILEGYAAFDVSTNEGGRTLEVTMKIPERNLEAKTTVRSLDYAKIVVDVENRGGITAGTGTHAVTIRAVDARGNALSGFDAAASIDFPKLSGTLSANFLKLKDGNSGTGLVFTPGTLAGENLSLDVRIPGIRDIEGNVVTVFPDVPMRVTLETEKAMMEAKTGESETVTARLFDRYGNLAYNHAEKAYLARFSIPEAFRKSLKLPENLTAFDNAFQKGVASVTVSATKTPGTPYLSVEVIPGLEKNAFTVSDKSGKSIMIAGYSKDAIAVDTYYLWNKSKIEKSEYNGLYTVLAGANFGDFTTKDFLAGEILFNSGSRSMAVTALLNDASLREKAFGLTPGGKVELPSGDSLVKGEISKSNGKTAIDFFDPFYKESVAKAYLNFAENTDKIACKTDGAKGIENCEIPSGSAFMLLKGYGKALAVSQNGLSLMSGGTKIVEFDANGAVSSLPSVRFEIDADNSKNLFAAKIFSDNTEIGYFAAKFRADSVVLSKKSDIPAALANNPGKIVLEAVSPNYSATSTYLGNSSRGARGIAFYSKRNEEKTVDREMIGSSSKTGFEEYRDKEGIGWQGANKTLLEFAGGGSVGEATRFNMSFSTVNLGDPTLRVKKLENQGNYDRSIGTKIADASSDPIETYKRFDFNGDKMDDLAVFFESGKIRLFANYSGTLKDVGYLAYVADVGKDRKGVGDFAKDGFHDIVLVSKDGALILLDNVEGKFVRKAPKIFNADGTSANLKGRVVQLETFDMDQDGHTDLVVSDEAGELNILYGGVGGTLPGKLAYAGLAASETGFTKKLLDSDLGLRVSGAVRKDGGALYFDSLPQLSAPDQAQYLKESAEMAKTADSGTVPTSVKSAVIDTKLFYLRTYKEYVTLSGATANAALATRLNANIGNDPNNPNSPNSALAASVLDSMSGAMARSASGSFNIASTTYPEERFKTYVRSDYAANRGVEVEKKFSDLNGGFLQTGDTIEITLRLTNKAGSILRNVSYLDSFDKKLFSELPSPTYSRIISSQTQTGTAQTGALSLLTNDSYDYAFEGFSLASNQTAIIKYQLKANSVSFGKFFVGKLETDDVYGDVAMRANDVCQSAATLWKSVRPYPRSYLRTTKTFAVSDSGNAGGMAGKLIDSNKNGQPDYTDLIGNPSVDPHAVESSTYNAKDFGLLLFRELPDSRDGTLNSGNIEVARLVANARIGNLQTSAPAGTDDVTARVDPSAVQASYDTASKTETAGNTAANTGSGLAECGISEYSVVSAPKVIGWKQTSNAPRSDLTVFFSTGSHSKDLGKTVEACKTVFKSSSDPAWVGGFVTGLGWKVLTQANYQTYALAAKKADFNKPSNGIPDDYDELWTSLFGYDQATGKISLDGLSDGNIEAIEASIDTLVQGLGCGFGGGACLSMPFNWAPLAPGSSPTVMGFPTDSLTTSTGLPIFSAINWQKVWKVCVPMPWPPATSIFCSGMSGAGGYLGDKGPTNFFRFYVTPTITGAVGAAACFGPVAAAVGRIPPPGISPVVPGGNCIVAAKPLLGCKDDGSDGDFSSLGYPNQDGFLNANSCVPTSSKREFTKEEKSWIEKYVAGDRNVALVDSIMGAYQSAAPMGNSAGPIVGVGLGTGEDPNFEVGIDPAALKSFDPGSIVKIKLERTSAFPDFIMDWVNRQTEEVVNKLTSLPTLYIIKPDFSRLYESGWNGFSDKLSEQLKRGQSEHKDTALSTGNAWLPGSSKAEANRLLTENSDTFNRVGKNVSGLKAAYEFLSNLPLIQFESETVSVDIPMFSEEDVEKFSRDFDRTKSQWKNEVGDKKQKWGKLDSKDGVDEKVFVEADATIASIEEWGRFLDDAKRFPDKLYKYLTWKERYANQILCNVEQVEQIMGGYIAENGKRFRTWVELYVLLKAILKSWQLMVDLFYDHSAECGVCRNERYDLKHFTFKIISAVIPKIPIIKFPKWPDIILDLHNIRLGLRILMPEFDFNLNPIVLPSLPLLTLPEVPTAGLALPMLPPPPKLPDLPELPDLPSLPMVQLPDLPPPPKIPKLFSAIEGILKILKLVAKILCILRKNPFVPEWRAGDQIAQITERQGKLPLDFFDVEFPNFPVAFLDAIKVTSFVNLEFQVDFILEMAKATFDPVNQFTGNVRNLGGNMTSVLQDALPDTDFSRIGPQDVRIEVGTPGAPEGMKKSEPKKPSEINSSAVAAAFAYSLATAFKTVLEGIEQEKGAELSVAEFKTVLANEAAKLSGDPDSAVRAIAWVLARASSDVASEDSAKLVERLSSANTEKFRAVKDAIRAEIREVETMKAKIADSERKNVGGSDIPDFSAMVGERAAPSVSLATKLASDSTDFESRASDLKPFEDSAARALSNFLSKDSESENDELKKTGRDLIERVRSLTAETSEKEVSERDAGGALLALADTSETGIPSFEKMGVASFAETADSERAEFAATAGSSEASAGSASSYLYSGIYVLDDGKKTRLFDYLDQIDGTEEAILINPTNSGTGKEDVVYRMDDGLYLKKNLTAGDAKVSTDRIKTYSLDDLLAENAAKPTAPNFFRESIVSSNQINFSFSPAKETDRRFRLEFFDYVDRFDRLARGDASSAPPTPSRVVDLFTDLRSETTSNASLTGAIIRSNVAFVRSGQGEGTITRTKLRSFAKGSGFTLSAGKSAFTDSGGAEIRYRSPGHDLWYEGAVGKNSNLQALATMEIDVTDGTLLLAEEDTEIETSVNLSDLKGSPLLPGTKIRLIKPASEFEVRYFDGTSYRLSGPAEYEISDLGAPAKEYSVSIPVRNDWYYSRLSTQNATETTTKASLTLLSPQIQADSEGPLVEFPTSYRIPVYLKDIVNMARYVRDASGVKDFFIDVDPTKDANGDGKPGNDRDSDRFETGSGFLRGTSWSELFIGPFNAPLSKKVRLVATDENNNVTEKDVSLVVYVPVPSITSATERSASGRIDLAREGEPIDLYRFRAEKLSRLTGSGQSTTNGGGGFSSEFVAGTGVVLKKNGGTVAAINERTGKIRSFIDTYSISVRSATASEPMAVVLSENGTVLYSQSFALPPSLGIETVSNWDGASKNGVFVKIDETSKFVRNPSGTASLPGGAFVVRSADSKAYLGIGSDGNLYLPEAGYSLSYRNEGEYPVISVKNPSGIIVAEVLYRLEAEFVIK